MQKSKALNIVIHVVGSLSFLLIPVISSPDFDQPQNLFFIPPFLRDFISYLLTLVFFYLSYYLLIPKIYFKGKYILFVLIAIAGFITISFLSHTIAFDVFAHQEHGQPPADFHKPPRGNHFFIRGILFQFLQFAIVVFVSLFIKINNRLKQSEKEKINAELSYLKAQINPHFLFNTLNSIYSLANEKSDKTADAVVKLSGMMRYVITYAENNYVSLDKELAYITDYIELQQLRLDDTVKISYSIKGEVIGKSVAPLLLIPFVENAFKYGVNSEQESDIKIEIEISDTKLKMMVINNKVTVSTQNQDKSGLSIENTRNRLMLLYPQKHKLVINSTLKVFSVNLEINF